jgi:hypothetical protein
MVFGAVLVAGFELFFEEVFFLVLFFAALFLAGAFLAVVVLGAVVLEPCAFAVNGTVDAPTNASRANAEINAFILWYS